jgi:adenylate kinase family enzyme
MDNSDFQARRICIVGSTGCGKTTLARRLAQKYQLEHIELDAIYWQPGWQPLASEVFRARVEARTQAPGWVSDGNYSKVRDITWARAEAIVWLDLSIGRIFWRLWRRTWRRALSKEKLWGTNQESLRSQFASRDSLFLWLFQTYWKNKGVYGDLLAQPPYQGLKTYRFRSPREVNKWLDGLR